MSQTIARTATVPAAALTRSHAAPRVALLILAALVAAFVALGIIDGVERIIATRPVGTAIIAVVMMAYAAGGAVGAAVLLPRRG